MASPATVLFGAKGVWDRKFLELKALCSGLVDGGLKLSSLEKHFLFVEESMFIEEERFDRGKRKIRQSLNMIDVISHRHS